MVAKHGLKASFIIILGAILAAIIFLVNNGKSANDINLINILPSLDASVVFIPMILYHFFGFEIITGVAGEMKKPTRDIPRSIIISAFILVLFYLAVMTAMWIVIPVDEINATSGVFDIFSRTFGNTILGNIISMVLGFFIIFTLFTAVVAWTLGQNRVVAEAAINGDMPKTLGKINKKTMVPVGAAIVSGLISTSVILLYGIVAKDAAGLFWNILSFSTIACLFSYVILFPVYIILRKKDAKIKRPYQVPGPEWFKISTAVVAEIFTLLTMVVLLIQPGEDFLESSLPVIIGTIIAIIVGEIIIRHSMKPKKRT
jgi:glutamate:GABA antiporter